MDTSQASNNMQPLPTAGMLLLQKQLEDNKQQMDDMALRIKEKEEALNKVLVEIKEINKIMPASRKSKNG